MNRIKKIFVLIHIFLWIMLSLLVILQLSGKVNPHWLSVTVAIMVTALYVFYGHFVLLTRYLGKNKKGAYFLWLAGIILTAPLLYLFIHQGERNPLHTFFEEYVITFFSIVPVFIFLSWLARVIENLIINTVKKEQLEKQAVEAELYYLKSQINPHFLFNTLNNIHTLVYKQAPTAPEAVLRLSSLMRYMIYESNAHKVSLSRELTYLKDYISLQQLRYKMSPVVDLQISGDTDPCFIAPLLFVHFLENAYKHSPGRLEPGDIQVMVEIKDNTLLFIIRNPVEKKPGNVLEEHGGIGLPNIKKRLQLLYPGTHTLEISNTGERYTIMLKINDLRSA